MPLLDRMSRIGLAVQLIEAGIAVGLQDAAEVAQVTSRMQPFAIRRVCEPHRRRIAAAGRSVIPNIGPQPTLFRGPPAGTQDRHRRVVGMEFVAVEHMPLQGIDQGPQQRTRLSDPVGQRRAIEINALPGIDLALAVQWQMVTIFRHEYMSQEAWPCESSGDRPTRCRRLNDLLTRRAAELGAHMAIRTCAVTGYRVERCSGASCTTFTQIGTRQTQRLKGDVHPEFVPELEAVNDCARGAIDFHRHAADAMRLNPPAPGPSVARPAGASEHGLPAVRD
jgi:hypothetical protein